MFRAIRINAGVRESIGLLVIESSFIALACDGAVSPITVTSSIITTFHHLLFVSQSTSAMCLDVMRINTAVRELIEILVITISSSTKLQTLILTFTYDSQCQYLRVLSYMLIFISKPLIQICLIHLRLNYRDDIRPDKIPDFAKYFRIPLFY